MLTLQKNDNNMKKTIFLTTVALMILFFIPNKIIAQTINLNKVPCVRLTTESGAYNIKIKLACEDDSSDVWVKTGTYNIEKYVIGQTETSVYATPNNNYIEVYGHNITVFDCQGKYEDPRVPITNIDFSKAPTSITKLRCSYTKITSLDVSRLTAIEYIACVNTLPIDGGATYQPALEDFLCSLPDLKAIRDYNSYIGGVICITNKNEGSGWYYNNLYNVNFRKAIHKGYNVIEYNYIDLPPQLPSANHVCNKPAVGTSYIEISSEPNTIVRLDLSAYEDSTIVWIEKSPGTFYRDKINKGWSNFKNYNIISSTFKVYGNLEGFDCSSSTPSGPIRNINLKNAPRLKELYCYNNSIKQLDLLSNVDSLSYINCTNNLLTELDLSNCFKLSSFRAYGNNFSTSAIDDIYCSLPDRTGLSDKGNAILAYNDADPNYSNITNSNSNIAKDKNWKVTINNGTEIPTVGTFNDCISKTPPAGTPYVSLKNRGTNPASKRIALDLKGKNDNTPVWIEIAPNTFKMTKVNSDWSGSYYHSYYDSCKIYGDIEGLDFTASIKDRMYNGCIAIIDLSKAPKLKSLFFINNKIKSLNISENCENLMALLCQNNKLTSLDFSKCGNISYINCANNLFSQQAIDDIYCSLPLVSSTSNLEILYLADNDGDISHPNIKTSNANNAINKGWDVLYKDTDNPISTTGEFACQIIPLPDITNLQAEVSNSCVTLTWDYNTPDFGNTILMESFDSEIPNTWGNHDIDGDNYKWSISKDAEDIYGFSVKPYQGDNAVFSSSTRFDNGWKALTPENILVSPDISGSLNLSYMISSSINTGHADYIDIGTSETTNTVFYLLTTDSCKNNYWSERSIDLPAGTKYVAFIHKNSVNSGNIVLDNIKFTDKSFKDTLIFEIYRDNQLIGKSKGKTFHDANISTSKDYEYCVIAKRFGAESNPACTNVYVSINDIEKLQANIYPNPASNILTVSSKENIKSVEVYNTIGELIYAAEPCKANLNINCSSWQSGLHVIKLRNESGEIGIYKIVKE